MKNTAVLILFFLNLIALTIAISWVFFDLGFESVITSVGLAGSMVVSTKEVLKKYSIVTKSRDLQLAVLGEVGVGKTVYLIVLLDELQRIHNGLIEFVLSGTATVESVMSQINDLYSGQWLNATYPHIGYEYSGHLTYKTKPIGKQFSVLFRDWGGGDYLDFASASIQNEIEWFHQSPYFDYVLHSDIVFLMMDVTSFTLKESREKQITEMIAAIQVLCQHKNPKNPSKKIETPVCLLFLKSDLIDERGITKGELLEKTDRLIQVCKFRFSNFEHFFVTSTGRLDENQKPKNLKPENVTEPVLWAIGKV